jgi:hypothetical protein
MMGLQNGFSKKYAQLRSELHIWQTCRYLVVVDNEAVASRYGRFGGRKVSNCWISSIGPEICTSSLR